LAGSIELCISGDLYAEYEEVISRPRFHRSTKVLSGALRAIRDNSLWFRPTETAQACSDPDDDIVLECAQAAGADYVVTGNLKHFRPRGRASGL
jgi:putative PIN family toxin of toxin-antitoxin system